MPPVSRRLTRRSYQESLQGRGRSLGTAGGRWRGLLRSSTSPSPRSRKTRFHPESSLVALEMSMRGAAPFPPRPSRPRCPRSCDRQRRRCNSSASRNSSSQARRSRPTSSANACGLRAKRSLRRKPLSPRLRQASPCASDAAYITDDSVVLPLPFGPIRTVSGENATSACLIGPMLWRRTRTPRSYAARRPRRPAGLDTANLPLDAAFQQGRGTPVNPTRAPHPTAPGSGGGRRQGEVRAPVDPEGSPARDERSCSIVTSPAKVCARSGSDEGSAASCRRPSATRAIVAMRGFALAPDSMLPRWLRCRPARSASCCCVRSPRWRKNGPPARGSAARRSGPRDAAARGWHRRAARRRSADRRRARPARPRSRPGSGRCARRARARDSSPRRVRARRGSSGAFRCARRARAG